MRLSALTTEGGFNNLASIVAANCLQHYVKQLKKGPLWNNGRRAKESEQATPRVMPCATSGGGGCCEGGGGGSAGRGGVACLHEGGGGLVGLEE